MTSLKIKNANEIISSMVGKLEDKSFTDMFVKEASEKEIEKEASSEEVEKDETLTLVAQFAISQLVKLANAVDKQGYNEISDEIDSLAKKIAELK